MKDLYEILTEKKWMIRPDFVHSIRKAFEQNLNGHLTFVKPESRRGFVSMKDEDGVTFFPEEYQISEDGKKVRNPYYLNDTEEQDFPFVSVITIDGPITRNGGGCSYGSIDHRDLMMSAADHPLCRGHIFIIDSPGGSAWAKNDYKQAIDYAHSKGQKVLAFIDGMCASAAMYLASFCDESYYMHPKNEIGSIGVMAVFYTEKNGGTNKYTNETYHEIYDPESFEKNKSWRDIANSNDDKALIEELAELGREFRADVKAAFPNATEEHLHGRVFNAEDVEGILVDGQSSFMEVVQRTFSLYGGSATPVDRSGKQNSSNPSDPESDSKAESQTKTSINMQNYPLINAACGLTEGEIRVTEEGAFMNAGLLDTLEAHMSSNEQKVAAAEQKVTELETSMSVLQAKIEELTSQIESANEARKAAEENLEAASKEHAEALVKKDEQIETLAQENAQKEEELKGAKNALATAEQNIADKDAQIASLTNDAGAEENAGESPSNNGEGVKTPSYQVFDPSGYKTNAERKEAFHRYMRGED